MSSGMTVAGAGDLDDIFDGYQGGTKPSATGITVGTQDLRDRYSPRAEGDDIGYTTGIATSSKDLREIFAAKGTSTQALVIPFGRYTATSSGSHDAGADFSLTLSPDGTWMIDLRALQGTAGGQPQSGTWHRSPAGGVGSNYQVRFTAQITISDNYTPSSGASYTASTGWVALNAERTVSASTGHLLAGGAGSGSVHVDGHWTVELRKVGSTVVRTSTCAIALEALAM